MTVIKKTNRHYNNCYLETLFLMTKFFSAETNYENKQHTIFTYDCTDENIPVQRNKLYTTNA
jgi:hypothetical protein